MRVVTSFNRRHWDDGLAKEMVETFLKHWEGFDLWCYVNGGIPEELAALPVRTIDHYSSDHFLEDFQRTYLSATHPLIWRDGRYEYRWDACRFAHKVCALDDATQLTRGDLVWLDADVISHAHVTPSDIRSLTEEYHDAAYLGRQGFSPEAGFLWLNLEKEGGGIVRDVHRYYRTGKIFDEPEWHDAYLFGKVLPRYASCNLTAGINGKHVWPESPLGKFCSHLKGPARKRTRTDLPDSEALAMPDAATGSL